MPCVQVSFSRSVHDETGPKSRMKATTQCVTKSFNGFLCCCHIIHTVRMHWSRFERAMPTLPKLIYSISDGITCYYASVFHFPSEVVCAHYSAFQTLNNHDVMRLFRISAHLVPTLTICHPLLPCFVHLDVKARLSWNRKSLAFFGRSFQTLGTDTGNGWQNLLRSHKCPRLKALWEMLDIAFMNRYSAREWSYNLHTTAISSRLVFSNQEKSHCFETIAQIASQTGSWDWTNCIDQSQWKFVFLWLSRALEVVARILSTFIFRHRVTRQ
jgi:hypothetical protein